MVHGASLLQFLIVSNQLSSDPVEHAKLASHPGARVSIVAFTSGRTNMLQGVAKAKEDLLQAMRCAMARAGGEGPTARRARARAWDGRKALSGQRVGSARASVGGGLSTTPRMTSARKRAAVGLSPSVFWI
jgi:hypothetical protein